MAKFRNGFVSNSSSSSFIVRVKDKNLIQCPNCRRILESMFEVYKARDYVVTEWGYDTPEDFMEECSEYEASIMQEAVKNDEEILYTSVEYGGEGAIENVLKALGITDYECD